VCSVVERERTRKDAVSGYLLRVQAKFLRSSQFSGVALNCKSAKDQKHLHKQFTLVTNNSTVFRAGPMRGVSEVPVHRS